MLFKRFVALMVCEALAFLPATSARAQQAAQSSSPTAQATTLRQHLQKPYLDLFELSPMPSFSAAEIRAQRESLKKGEDFCVKGFKAKSKDYQKQIDAARQQLKKNTAKLSESERTRAHCNIQNLDLLQSEAGVLAGQAIPTAYDNLIAKLDLIERWPAVRKQIENELASGSHVNRHWGDVQDIGFREIAAGQQDDIKDGQKAVEEMKRLGLMPPQVEDRAIQDYVNSVAQNVARHSDLKVPLHVEVLQSREINAFALPGGYLFIERGLLEATDDESELAGVIAHEIAHDAARHGHKLMKRATIAGIFFQAAQVAAIVLTGGVAGIGTYYAIQYGFYGLGLVLNLKLLGVSRDYELEADQLGVQYAWSAGYDPSGFIRFFDKMATREGYINGVSWFRTHPPFYNRMEQSEREIMFLERKPSAVVVTSAFEQMKKALAPIAAKAEKEDANAPSLKITRAEGCEPPKKLEYKPGQPIEQLCSAASRTESPGAKPQP